MVLTTDHPPTVFRNRSFGVWSRARRSVRQSLCRGTPGTEPCINCKSCLLHCDEVRNLGERLGKTVLIARLEPRAGIRGSVPHLVAYSVGKSPTAEPFSS